MNKDVLLQGLNDQGFLFQEMCAHELRAASSQWTIRSTEYPVSYWNFDVKESTRIDIVIRVRDNPDAYGVVECKRANPDYVAWVFGSATFERPALCPVLALVCNEVRSDDSVEIDRRLETRPFSEGSWTAGSWMEVKKDGSRRSTAQAVEDALRQVLRGVEGLALEHQEQVEKAPSPFKTLFYPMIITTASLYIAEYEFQDIDHGSGTLSSDKVSFGGEDGTPKEVGWVMVDYAAGEEITREAIPAKYKGTDPAELIDYKGRRVYIVNSRHISDFFGVE